jgi:TolB-like protein/DNA-binding SARP family transcriptional activator/Flp pilus assembly protein TadD
MIRLRVFGALDLRGPDGQEVRSVLAQPKRSALLVYLALTAGAHRRDKLLALFWPEQDAERGRNALSQAVHFLRRALGDNALSSTGDELALARSAFWCDAIAFEEALASARCDEALDLYQGDLLDGFHVGNAPGFEHWLDMERSRLALLYAQAVERVADEHARVGDSAAAVALWRRLAVRDPLGDRVALRYLRALVAAGDRAGALQHARVHELLLREELEIAPSAELTAFVKQLHSAPAAAPAPAAAVPVPVPVPVPTARPAESTTTAAVVPVPQASNVKVSPRRRRAVMLAAGLVALAALVVGGSALRNRQNASNIPLVRSIAVLPFEDLSGDSTHQSLADGLHDAIITELARYPELSVTSRTSAVQYKGTMKRLPEIARELHVDGIVEGTIQREAGRVRVTGQLLHGPTDRHLWAGRYTRDLGDVLTLQEELAAAIGAQVHVTALPPRRVVRAGMRPAGRELFLRELIVRGTHAELSRSPVGMQTAKDAYERAVREDSTFALGYAALSGAYGALARYGYMASAAARDTAGIMARRAVELDSTLAEAHTALAITHADAFAFAEAEREFRAAIALSPSNAQARYWYSMLLVALGRGSEALREARRALALDPFPPRGLIITLQSAEYVATGERSFMKKPAGRRWESFLRTEPGEPWAHRANAFDLAEVGKCSEARDEIAQTSQLAPGRTPTLVAVAMVEWWCGDRARAHRLLAQAERVTGANAQATLYASAHATWGEIDSAFVWLDRVDGGLGSLMDLRASRWLDPVRSDRRYPQLLRRLGLPVSNQN